MNLNNSFFANFKFAEDFENKSWVEIIEEEENRRKSVVSKENDSAVGEPVVISSKPKDEDLNGKENEDNFGRTNRKRLLPEPKAGWVEPNKGWCWQEEKIIRREKELQRMKGRSAYLRYISQVPRSTRKKGVHPRTPNKFINWSRRSWDKQVKMWKLAIYEWACLN